MYRMGLLALSIGVECDNLELIMDSCSRLPR
jgi:hypothetical protein